HLDEIDNIELSLLDLSDYDEFRELMISSYVTMPDAYWKKHHIETLVQKFPEGQAVIKVNGKMVAAALSIIVDYDSISEKHTYRDITSQYTFDSHDDKGDVLYGIDVFVHPEYRGLRLGRRL